jgi:hypothetical protein
LPGVQATVRSFDGETRSGTVLLDDGTELPYAADALAGGPVRHLRVGQRVAIETTGDTSRTVTFLTIYTLPDHR